MAIYNHLNRAMISLVIIKLYILLYYFFLEVDIYNNWSDWNPSSFHEEENAVVSLNCRILNL